MGGGIPARCAQMGVGWGQNFVKQSENQVFPFWCFELPEVLEDGTVWLSGCPVDAPRNRPLEGADITPHR